MTDETATNITHFSDKVEISVTASSGNLIAILPLADLQAMAKFWLMRGEIMKSLANSRLQYAYGVGAMTDRSGKGGTDDPNQERCSNEAGKLASKADDLLAKIKAEGECQT